MKNKSYKLLLSEYQEKYGNIPLEKDDILDYLDKTLKLTEKDYIKIQEEEEKVANIPWEELQIILPIIPKPSPRPRYSSKMGSFYVTENAIFSGVKSYPIKDEKFNSKSYKTARNITSDNARLYLGKSFKMAYDEEKKPIGPEVTKVTVDKENNIEEERVTFLDDKFDFRLGNSLLYDGAGGSDSYGRLYLSANLYSILRDSQLKGQLITKSELRSKISSKTDDEGKTVSYQD